MQSVIAIFGLDFIRFANLWELERRMTPAQLLRARAIRHAFTSTVYLRA